MYIKTIFFSIFLLLLGTVSNTAMAQSAQERFDELFSQGDELYYAFEYEDALPNFQQALDIALNENLPFSDVYNSLYSIALCYKNAFMYEEGIDHILYSIDTFESKMSPVQIGEQYYVLGSTYLNFDRFDDALAAYGESIRHYEEINAGERLARAYAARGIAYIEMDNYKLAQADLEQAETIVPDNNDAAKSFIYMTFFSLYEYMGNPTGGIFYLQKAHELAKKTGSKKDQLNTAIYLANKLVRDNEYSEGLKYANEGLYLAKETNDLMQLSTVYDIIGKTYFGLAEYEQSMLHYNEAIEIYRQLDLDRKAAELEIIIADIALRQGDLNSAELLLSEVPREGLSDRYIVTLLLKQAQVQLKLGNFTSADTFLKEALTLADDDLAVIKPQIFKYYLAFPDEVVSEQQKISYAKMNLQSARSNSVVSKMAAEVDLAMVFEPINSDSAFHYAYTALDRLEDRRMSTHSTAFKNSLNANWQHVYYTLANWEVHHKNDYSTAFNLFERAKSRALFDQIYERRFFSLFDAENPSTIQLLELQKKIDKLYQQEADPVFAPDNNLAMEIAELELNYQTLQDELMRSNPAMRGLEYPSVATLKDAQGLLDNNTAIISYGLTEDKLYTFLLKKNDLRFIPVQSTGDFRAELTQNIETFRSAIIGQQDEVQLQAASTKLTDTLLDSIMDELSDIEHLIIIPDGPLHLLPFEALRINDEYLIERFAIKYIPSVSVLSVINERQPLDFERSLLGLASSGFESGDDLAVARSQASFSTLPYTLAEIDSIQTNFPESKILKNETVTEAAFKALDLSEYRFMHFATHGNINESVPDQSGLILSKKTETETLFGEDGYLNAREISQLSISANLVVLSACNTGIGRIINGEGVMGLQRSFLAAGASSVMVSLWNIFDRSTPIFMNLFYENLLEIEDDKLSFIDKAMMYANLYSSDIVDFKTLALQQTKKQMIEHPYYSHPVHWAPFILTGK